MAYTTRYSVGLAEQDIVAGSYTKRVTIAEYPGVALWPTTEYSVKAPGTANLALRKPSGTSYTFEGNFHTGQVLGTVAAVTAATTFQQDEE